MEEGLYRFTHKKYLDNFFRGEVRFGHHEYYRGLEIYDGDQITGDKNEGCVEFRIKEFEFNSQTATPDQIDFFKNAGILGPGALDKSAERKIKFSDVNVIMIEDSYLFCGSYGTLEDIAPHILKRYPKGEAAALRMRSPRQFIEAIGKGTFQGRPVQSEFVARLSPVRYGDNRVQDVGDKMPFPEGDSFIKDMRYKDDCEFRMALQSRNYNYPELGNFITVQIENPEKMWREVDVSQYWT
jgi:hypothetical protein